MATRTNAVDPETFAEVLLASIIDKTRGRYFASRDMATGVETPAGVTNDLWLENSIEGFSKQYRAALALALQRVQAPDLPVTDDRTRLYQVVDRLLPDVRGRRLEQKIDKILEIVADTHDPIAGVHAAIAGDNAALRQRFMDTVPTLTSAEVARAAGHLAKNSSQTASRWKALNRVLAVRYQGQDRYPAFQFEEARPREIIREVLAILPETMTPWQRALWFVSSNSWVGGATPVDLLDDPESLLGAARHQRDDIPG